MGEKNRNTTLDEEEYSSVDVRRDRAHFGERKAKHRRHYTSNPNLLTETQMTVSGKTDTPMTDKS